MSEFFTVPALWKRILEEIKRTTNLNRFILSLKKYYLKYILFKKDW